MKLKNIGYYIIQAVPKPHYLSLSCKKIISAGSCICNMHPILSGCFWQGHNTEKAEYKKYLSLSDDEYKIMCNKVSKLFEEEHIDVDSRFIYLKDAIEFYQTYLINIPDIYVVCVSTSEKFFSELIQEDYWGQNADIPKESVQGIPIGGEIFGFDRGSFHSYLCNGLDKDIKKQKDLICDYNNGLIKNDFAEIEIFADIIDGLGEPVGW